MQFIIDGGYWTWNKAYSRVAEPWHSLDTFIESGAVIALDSARSIRKQHIPWYKSKRGKGADFDPALKERAIELCRKLKLRYSKDSIAEIDGFEADDVVALLVGDCDIVIGNDKDYWSIHGKFDLRDAYMNPITMDTWQKKAPKGVTLSRGNSFLTYQLLYGDFADSVPRLLDSKDRWSGPVILASENPLQTAIDILPDTDKVRQHLLALMLPCPLLISDTRDILEIALERHPV